MGRPLIDISGQRFGRLTVVKRVGLHEKHHIRWLCACDCGNTTTARGAHLKAGFVASCGCLRAEVAQGALARGRTKHGLSATAEYRIRIAMLARCYNPKHSAFADYGGRGIKVCDRWRGSFEAFLADMGPRPSPRHSIDREKADGDYEPGNCRWATHTEQMNNIRRTVYVEHDGQRIPLAVACRQIGVVTGKVAGERIRNGWSERDALTTPLKFERRPERASGRRRPSHPS